MTSETLCVYDLESDGTPSACARRPPSSINPYFLARGAAFTTSGTADGMQGGDG
jgi:hypothetical protein